MRVEQLPESLVATGAYVVFGLVVFALAFWVMNKVSPFSLRKEIEEDQNIALGIIMAGIIIGIALVISAAISG